MYARVLTRAITATRARVFMFSGLLSGHVIIPHGHELRRDSPVSFPFRFTTYFAITTPNFKQLRMRGENPRQILGITALWALARKRGLDAVATFIEHRRRA